MCIARSRYVTTYVAINQIAHDQVRDAHVYYNEVTAATDAPILKKKIIILYGYSLARVQRTTIASSTIGDVNNYNQEFIIGERVSNSPILY